MEQWKTSKVSSLSSAAEQRKFAMTFVWRSSGNSSRWKRKTVTQEEEEEVESGEVESRRVRHVDGHG